MPILPMFPLGTALLPGSDLPLQIFEPRYQQLVRDCMAAPDGPRFGVVLIARGHEVGGGEQRHDVGTVARVLEARELPDGRWAVGAVGTRRIRITEWLPDDPYPQARVRTLPPLAWTGDLTPRLAQTERAVRRALATLSEFGDTRWPASVEVSDDPLAAAWQLAGIAPLSPLDHVALLRSPTAPELLDRTAALAAEATELAAFRLRADDPGTGDA